MRAAPPVGIRGTENGTYNEQFFIPSFTPWAVVVDIGARRTEVEISMPVARTVDIGFVHDGADQLRL